MRSMYLMNNLFFQLLEKHCPYFQNTAQLRSHQTAVHPQMMVMPAALNTKPFSVQKQVLQIKLPSATEC